MPTASITSSTVAQVGANTDLLSHLSEISKIYGPMMLLIFGLIVYIWRKQDDTTGKVVIALDKHVKEDDLVHDKLFEEIRKLAAQVNHLQGVCDGRDDCK